MATARRQFPPTEAPDERCRSLAAQQFGVLSREQARGLGVNDNAIARRVARHTWERILPGIYGTERIGDPWLKQLMAGCLKAKTAAVSHRSAGALWQLDGINPGALDITIPASNGHLRLDDFTVHRTRHMPPTDLTWRGRLPMTQVERTLVDLAGVLTAPSVEAALDSALRKRLTNLARVRTRLQRSPAHGVTGIAVLKRLVNDRWGGGSVMGSPLEAKFLNIIRRAKLPEPTRQWWIRDGKRFIARVDFLYPELKLAIEIDSLAHHFGGQALQRDRQKDNELQRLGWVVLRFTAADLDDSSVLLPSFVPS